jgi:ribose 5-phosphate isomerase A
VCNLPEQSNMRDEDRLKQATAEAAMAFLPESGVIGLGTGTTARHAIRLIAAQVAAKGLGLVAVATSRASAQAAAEAGIPLLDEEGPWEIDVTFDGADEVTRELDLIKGGGGALLREKIVNAASALNVILVDDSKLSDRLGQRFRLPVEVVPFGWAQTRRNVQALAGPSERRECDGSPFITDNGNYVLDVHTGPIDTPAALEQALQLIPGVVVAGLFVRRTDLLVVAGEEGVEIRRREG